MGIATQYEGGLKFDGDQMYITTSSGTTLLTLGNTGNATFAGTIGATNFSGSSSGTNTGDQTLPTDFVSKASGGTFAGTISSTATTAVAMDGAAASQGVTMQADSQTTYPVFLRSLNPSSGGETSPWLYKEHNTEWGIWHNNPINAFDFTRSGADGFATNVGGGTNAVTIRLNAQYGTAQFHGAITAAGYNDTNWNTAYTHSQAAHAPSNAEQNVQSDWNATTGDSFIQNKPTIPTLSSLGAVPLAGGKMTGILSHDNRAATNVAHWSASGNSTGSIKITLPGSHSSNWSMLVLRITAYEYNSSNHTVYYVSGHDWTSGWYANGVTKLGDSSKDISLGYDDSKDYVILGLTSASWAYGHVTVDVVSHPSFYSTSMDISSGWAISQVTSLEGITVQSVTNRKVLTNADEGSGNGIDADTVDGIQAASFLRSDANDTASGTLTLSGSDWYLLGLGARGASGGAYGIGNRNDNSYRQLTFHVPNQAAYASTGTLPSFGWYSNGAVQLMKLESDSGNLWLKGALDVDTISIGSTVTLTESTDRADLLYINSGTDGWGGLQIGNTSDEFIFSLMGNGNAGGIYDDQNGDWIIYWDENAGVQLKHNTNTKLTTTSTGVTVTGDIAATNFSGSSSGTNTGDQDLSGLISSITVGTGLDGTTASGDATISLDLSELTDMTADITTTVDELILLDDGAERRKRFSEIFGSAAYSNTSAFAAAAHSHAGTYALEYELMQSDSSDRDMHVWRKNHAMLSDDSGVNTYIIVQTNVPQDNYSMGGFTLVYQDAYNSSGEGGEIKIYGYWNPESNSGFEGFRYECSNPYHTPTIEVCRNSSSGKTAFFISGEGGSYTQLLAKDLWLGYSAASATSQWGDSWTVTQASAKDGYTNFDTLNRNDFAAITTNGSTPSLTGGVSATEIRTLIGAGTGSSDLTIGTTATTAMAGNTAFASTAQGATADAALPKAGGTLTGGLTISGSLSRGTYTTTSNYATGADNIVLKGNAAGRSGIFFESEKDGTNINHPSDFAYIQYHAYGTLTSGEANELRIGVSNDADDHIVFNAPDTNGMKFRIGSSSTEYTVYHSGNLTASTLGALTTSGKAADSHLLDGIDSTAFLRSNAADSFDGTLSWGNSFGTDAFDLNGGDIEDARGVRAREFTQIASGIPRNNLGDPTVTEMALFESQFTCKTDLSNGYNDLNDLVFYKQMTSGGAWEEVTVSDDQKRRFLRTNNSSVAIPNTAYKFRVEFNASGYTFANAIYFYWSSNSHNTPVHIWKQRASDDQWLQHSSSTTTVSSWPGHLWLPFSTIPWLEDATSTSTGHYHKVRVEFTPNWASGTYSDRVINLYGGQVWGGYPSGRRTPHYYDQNGKLFTYGDLEANGKLYIDTRDANTSSTTALVMNGNEVEQRTLGTNAFNSTAFTTLAIGTTATTAMAGNTTIPSGNQIIDWTADQGDINIHSGNYTNTTYSAATTSAAGLMSSTDKTKLDGVATGANVTPSWLPSTDPSYLTSLPSHNHDDRYYTETEIDSTLNTLTASLRANTNITGGGTVTIDGSGFIKNSQRFIVIANGRGSHFATNGYFDITIPTSGTITGVGGSANRTALSAGIQLNAWEALYYILPINATNTSVPANFRVAKYTASVSIPEHWVLIAVRNGDTGQKIWVINKYGLELGESVNTAVYDSRTAQYAASAGAVAYSNVSGTPTIPSGNAIIDWTTDQGTTKIHANNYTDTDTWVANSATAAGYVASGANQNSKVWKTNASGVPAWRDDASGGTDTNYYLDGVTRVDGTDTLEFSVNGATNQTFAFGANAFNSTTIPAAEAYTAHEDTSTLSGVYGDTANGTKIDTITVDANGHITAIATGATGNMTGFFVEDGDGTEVQINNANEWKFVEGAGIDINWSDTSTGSDTDPYDLTFTCTIDSPGEVGLGNLSSDGNALAGTFTATGDLIAYSDARVKENVETIPNALEKVTALRGVNFNKIGEEKRSTGVIAQEVKEVLPEVVHETEDGMLAVAYGNITGVLIEAIKEQQKQIDELKAMVVNLKNNK